MPPAVTVCIPAYQAEIFLAETLASVRAQTWPNLRVVISVDRSSDRTAELAHAFAREGAASVVMQTTRLGWVGNVNAALAHVATPFAMILPHDDLVAPTYVEACLEALRADPQAVAAFTDIETFGMGRTRILSQPSITGAGIDRVETFLRDHFNAVAFRAVFDARRAPRCLVPAYAIGDFAADTLWMARLTCHGHLIRVAQQLYRKRLLPSSVHAAWMRSSDDDEIGDMWIVHCAELAWEFLRTRPALWVERRFWDAVRDRLLGRGRLRSRRGVPPARLRDRRDPIMEMMRTYWSVRRRPTAYRWMTAAP